MIEIIPFFPDINTQIFNELKVGDYSSDNKIALLKAYREGQAEVIGRWNLLKEDVDSRATIVSSVYEIGTEYYIEHQHGEGLSYLERLAFRKGILDAMQYQTTETTVNGETVVFLDNCSDSETLVLCEADKKDVQSVLKNAMETNKNLTKYMSLDLEGNPLISVNEMNVLVSVGLGIDLASKISFNRLYRYLKFYIEY